MQSSSQCPVCRRPLVGLAEQAANVLRDAVATAVARGVPATKLAYVEKKMWKMVSDVAALEPPAEKKALTLPPLKLSSSTPLLRGKGAGSSVEGRSYAARNSLRVVAPADAAVSSDPGAQSIPHDGVHTNSEPKVGTTTGASPSGSVKIVRGSVNWRQRHKRIHLDEPISIAEVTAAPPAKSRAAIAAEEEAKAQRARQVAYLLGSLRDKALGTGGEIDRNSFYAALVEHGMLADDSSVAFTEAPVPLPHLLHGLLEQP